MRWGMALAIVLVSASGARAQDGQALAALEPRAVAALGAGYAARVEDDRITLTCAGCDGTPIVELRVGRQEDGEKGGKDESP